MLILGIIRSFSCTRDGITAFRSLVNHRAVHTHIVHQSNSALSTSTSLTILNPLTVWLTTNSGKLLYRREYQTNLPASWEMCMEANKQQLELDMEQWARSKLGKEYVKAVSCHLAYLTYFTVLHMNSSEGRKKPLATCSSHLSVVSLTWCRVRSDQIRSVTQSCPTLCNPMNCSTPGLPVHHQLPEFTETHIMWNPGLDEAQAGIKTAGRNINNLRYAHDTTLMAESKDELKNLLMKVKKDSEKAGLKLNIQKTKIMASGPITWWQIDGEAMETVTDFILGGSKITADGDCSHEIKRYLLLGRKAMKDLDSILKSRDITDKGPYNQSYGFSSSHVWMLELGHKESWVPKNWCFWTVVLEKTLESPLDCKIQPVNLKWNQSWIFIGRTDAEAEAPLLWSSDAKNWLRKDPDSMEDWRQEEKGMTEDEMVGWLHWLNRHEFEQASGVGDGQGSLACCSPWSRKELDMTEGLNWIIKLRTHEIIWKVQTWIYQYGAN